MMATITVQQAEALILSEKRDYGSEEMDYATSLGRVLAEPLFADRDLPPFNRATVDGIAITFSSYEEGVRHFHIRATQAAGAVPSPIMLKDESIEIMTGAALDPTVDTVIRYEDIDSAGGTATVKDDIHVRKGQNVHLRGVDKKQHDVIASADRTITPALIGLAASIGKIHLSVRKLPRVAIISTGDELVSPELQPTPYQLRRSNSMTIQSVLSKYAIDADRIHLSDDYALIKNTLDECLQRYDVLLLTGGVSMGKFDYIPEVLADLSVSQRFHRVQQRPGKPFWFGTHQNHAVIFAFPGNPVSVFMCLHRYFLPWLETSLRIGEGHPPEYAVLQNDLDFPYALQYFAQVKLSSSTDGRLLAEVIPTNGSGDFSALIQTNAFIELPMGKDEFHKGESYRIWRYDR